tara:strand:+ start:5003 stop:7477 length:2475 start_codon:yes stop_codon:yes gene_type:complete
MVYRLLEHDDEFLVKLLCGWCDIRQNGLFVALVSRRLRDVVHLATRYEQRRRLIELSWPGHDSEDPLPGYVPRYRTVCQLSGCFLTESRMLFVFDRLATPGTDLHRLLWQQGPVDDAAKGRFDDAVARCYPYDPRQRQASTRQRVLMNVAAYRMTYRSLNAMLEVASLRCIRRCFLEILGGHRVCRLDPYQCHDQCLFRFAGRHGRVDVLNHLLSRDPSKGLSFDFADGLAEAFRALLQGSDVMDLGPERSAAVTHNPVTALLSSAAANDAVATLEWFERVALHRCGWAGLNGAPRSFFWTGAKMGVTTALLGTMLKFACANNSRNFMQKLVEAILFPVVSSTPLDELTPLDVRDWTTRFCLWAFVVLSTRPTDVQSLHLLVTCCHELNAVLIRNTRMLFDDLKQTHANTPTLTTILHAEQEMQFGEQESGFWNEPEGLMDLRRLVVLVDLVLPLQLPSLIRHLGWNRHGWRQTEQTLFTCTAPGPVLRLLVSEIEESIEQRDFPTGRRNGWLLHSWQSMRARPDSHLSFMMMLRNDIDPERWNAMRTLTHHWLRELHGSGSRSMLLDGSRFDELEFNNCYRWLYNTMMYHKTPRPNFGDPLSHHWLPLEVASYAVIPNDAFLDGKASVGNRVSMAHEIAGHVFGLWWEAMHDTFDTDTVDPLSVSIIGMAPCPVYQWFSMFVETLDHEARTRAESQFGQLVLYTLDREIASMPRYTLCNVALMALAGWAERQGHIPEDLITTFLTTLRARQGLEEQSCSSLAHQVLNRPDPHASSASVDARSCLVVEGLSTGVRAQRILPGWMRAGRASERAVFDFCDGLRLQ